jgi:DNA-binding Lrp family transcriptional regulator
MRNPTADEILAIAERHGVTPEWLRSRIASADAEGWMDEKGYQTFRAMLEVLELLEDK